MPNVFTLDNQELHIRVEEDHPQRVAVAPDEGGEVTLDGKALTSQVVTGPFTLNGTGRVVIEDATEPKKAPRKKRPSEVKKAEPKKAKPKQSKKPKKSKTTILGKKRK